MELNREEITKALECCLLSNEHQVEECNECPFNECPTTICQNLLAYHALALIKELIKEKDNLEYTLEGVMHFVDKWLDGEDLKENEVTRAEIMRERTLQIMDELYDENGKLTRENDLYKETVGRLIVKDGEVIGFTRGTEVRYIEKSLAETFKNMAVNQAKVEIAREIFEEIKRETKNHGICYTQRKIAELEKKYTEEGYE